jgi:transposase
MKKLTIELSQEQRQALEDIISKGKERARKIMHAHVLLKADSGPQGPNWSDQHIQEAFGVGASTIWRLRRRVVEKGLDDALNRRPQPERPEKRKVNGQQEAYLLALTCSQAPAGRKHWTLRLLADKMVALGYSEPISHKTVWVVLKKMNSNRG